MVVDTARATLREFLRQAISEMATPGSATRVLDFGALLAHIIYCGGMLAAAIASAPGNRGGTGHW